MRSKRITQGGNRMAKQKLSSVKMSGTGTGSTLDDGNAPHIHPRVFQHTVNQAGMAIAITDVSGTVLYVNPAFSRVTGYSYDEIIGQNQSILSNKTTPPEIYRGLWQNIARGEPWAGQLINRRKDGTKYVAELNISPVTDARGVVINYLGMQRDVTEVHRLECQVKNQKALIESVVDVAPMVIALLDAGDKVVLDNQEYKKLQADLGMLEPSTLLMSAIRAGLDPDAPPDRHHSGYVFLDREVRLDPPGGKAPRWFSCSGSVVREDDARADTFFVAQSRDYLLLVAKEITGLRAEQEKVRVAALRAMMADEDRTSALRESLSAATFRLEGPLNMMASVAAMMARRKSESDPMAIALADAIAAGQQALEDLRGMIPAGKNEAFGSANINELVRDVLDLSTGRLLAAGVSVSWKPQMMMPAVKCHPNKLRAMFKALIENAIDAMTTRGWRERELSVSTQARLGSIEVAIEDTGPGIEPDKQIKVFEPFYTTRRGHGHLGTGLSSAQETAVDHGGSIEVDPALSKGCRIIVTLPLHRRS